VMASTIAVLTFMYGFVVVMITHFAAEKLRSSPKATGALNKIAGMFLIGFGIKLAVSK
jgi:leucine efflux protein